MTRPAERPLTRIEKASLIGLCLVYLSYCAAPWLSEFIGSR